MTHVSADDAPMITFHGTADRLVPFAQSTAFNRKLVAAGVDSHLITIEGGGHGNFGKASREVDLLVREFLSQQLQGTREAKIERPHAPSRVSELRLSRRGLTRWRAQPTRRCSEP